MKKTEIVYNEILHKYYESNNKRFTQSDLSEELEISLSTVNNALKPLREMNVIKTNPMNFVVLDHYKMLLFWATKRKFQADIFYKTRVEDTTSRIEQLMPDKVIFAAFSAFKFRFEEIPADYSEVYVYAERKWKERFPEKKGPSNVFFLEKEKILEKYGKITTIAQTFVDLWNINTWYAQEFLKNLEDIVRR
jgi:predicted transcriptional regulator